MNTFSSLRKLEGSTILVKTFSHVWSWCLCCAPTQFSTQHHLRNFKSKSPTQFQFKITYAVSTQNHLRRFNSKPPTQFQLKITYAVSTQIRKRNFKSKRGRRNGVAPWIFVYVYTYIYIYIYIYKYISIYIYIYNTQVRVFSLSIYIYIYIYSRGYASPPTPFWLEIALVILSRWFLVEMA